MAFKTEDIMFKHILQYFDLPEDIISDWGTQVMWHVWKKIMEKLGVAISLISGYHSQANGQVERANQETGQF